MTKKAVLDLIPKDLCLKILCMRKDVLRRISNS